MDDFSIEKRIHRFEDLDEVFRLKDSIPPDAKVDDPVSPELAEYLGIVVNRCKKIFEQQFGDYWGNWHSTPLFKEEQIRHQAFDWLQQRLREEDATNTLTYRVFSQRWLQALALCTTHLPVLPQRDNLGTIVAASSAAVFQDCPWFPGQSTQLSVDEYDKPDRMGAFQDKWVIDFLNLAGEPPDALETLFPECVVLPSFAKNGIFSQEDICAGIGMGVHLAGILNPSALQNRPGQSQQGYYPYYFGAHDAGHAMMFAKRLSHLSEPERRAFRTHHSAFMEVLRAHPRFTRRTNVFPELPHALIVQLLYAVHYVVLNEGTDAVGQSSSYTLPSTKANVRKTFEMIKHSYKTNGSFNFTQEFQNALRGIGYGEQYDALPESMRHAFTEEMLLHWRETLTSAM